MYIDVGTHGGLMVNALAMTCTLGLRMESRLCSNFSVYSQRSPVLVSLLPTSQEASPWFLDRTKALPLSER